MSYRSVESESQPPVELLPGELYLVKDSSEGIVTAPYLYEFPPKEIKQGEDTVLVRQYRFLVDDRESSIAETDVLGLAEG